MNKIAQTFYLQTSELVLLLDVPDKATNLLVVYLPLIIRYSKTFTYSDG